MRPNLRFCTVYDDNLVTVRASKSYNKIIVYNGHTFSKVVPSRGISRPTMHLINKWHCIRHKFCEENTNCKAKLITTAEDDKVIFLPKETVARGTYDTQYR